MKDEILARRLKLGVNLRKLSRRVENLESDFKSIKLILNEIKHAYHDFHKISRNKREKINDIALVATLDRLECEIELLKKTIDATEKQESIKTTLKELGTSFPTRRPMDVMFCVDPGPNSFPVLPLKITIDKGDTPDDDVAELLSDLSILYRMMGGSGITFETTEVEILTIA
jgi:hypothetical protein